MVFADPAWPHIPYKPTDRVRVRIGPYVFAASELRALRGRALGMTCVQIARKQRVAYSTVWSNLCLAKKRLGLRSLVDAAVWLALHDTEFQRLKLGHPLDIQQITNAAATGGPQLDCPKCSN